MYRFRRLPVRVGFFHGLCLLGLLASTALLAPCFADEVDDLNAQVNDLTREGRYPEASAVAQSAADMARQRHGEDSTQYARAISWQAYLLQARGKPDQAEVLFEKSLAIYQRVLPAGHPDIATSINNLGFSYQNSDRLIEAEQMYKRALDMRENAVPFSELAVAESLNNLAQCYKRQERIAEAYPLSMRALAIRRKLLPPHDPLIAQSLTNVGSTLELQERFDAAEPYYREALDIRRKSQNADHPDIAGALNKLAEILFKRGRYKDAEAVFRDVIEQRYRTQAAGHIDIATSLTARAENLIELKIYGEAKTALRNALAIQQMGLPPLHPSIARTQANLGRIARLEGDTRQALALLRVAAVSQAARGRSDDLARQHFAEFVGAAYDTTVSRAANPATSAADAVVLTQALEMAQRSGLTETAAAVTRMAARFSSQDAALRDVMRDREEVDAELRRRELELSAILALPPEERANSVEIERQQLAKLSDRRTQIDAELKVKFPSYASLVSPDPMSLEQVRALLSPGEVLVYYFCGTDGVYVWGITRENSIWRKLDVGLTTLSASVSKLRETLDLATLSGQGVKAKLFNLELSHQLYVWLLGSVEPLMTGKSHLVIVPSGPMTSLPFQTLLKTPSRVKQPGLAELAVYREADWLMNHTAISVMPALSSLRALRATAQRPLSTKPLIGFGNPVFEANAKSNAPPSSQSSSLGVPGGAALSSPARPIAYASFWRGPAADVDALRAGLPPLPETEAELRSVGEKLKAAAEDIHLGAAATEAAVKSIDLTKYRVVYFATHGLVAGEMKGLGEPALALSLPTVPSDLDDGLLTASEVSQLRLNADWVILSACNTADARTVGAEALSGLAKSFFHAGARAMLVSHWRVGSAATTRMTTSVFDIMARNPAIGRAEALRQGMRTFLADTSDPWNAYPIFWAPFAVVGEGGV